MNVTNDERDAGRVSRPDAEKKSFVIAPHSDGTYNCIAWPLRESLTKPVVDRTKPPKKTAVAEVLSESIRESLTKPVVDRTKPPKKTAVAEVLSESISSFFETS